MGCETMTRKRTTGTFLHKIKITRAKARVRECEIIYHIYRSDIGFTITISRGVQFRGLSAFGSLWLALIVVAIDIVLDLRQLGAGRALGPGTRAGSEHRRRRERRESGEGK